MNEGIAIMASIQPMWCLRLFTGEKTLEVRKTKPKLEAPFRCYVYETQGYTNTPFMDEEGHCIFRGSGDVIGEFICDDIIPVRVFENGAIQNWIFNKLDRSCLKYQELAEYIGNDKTGYAWHITNPVRYHKPKPLSEFYVETGATSDCPQLTRLKRPPQSWQYVETVCIQPAHEHCNSLTTQGKLF